MRIGLDAMGGDYAPAVVVKGALDALKRMSNNTQIVLFGDKLQIESFLGGDNDRIEIVHCSEVIEMGDHPAKAFQQKADSSITKGFTYLKAGKIDGFASAGSTGAMMVGSMLVIGQVEGVVRPTICTPIATIGENPVVILDAGLNADCKPEVLAQYAVIGSIYAKEVLKINNPRVGLLNIGEEEEKGTLLTKAAFVLIKDIAGINFVGNVEANHIFDNSKADVIVCDGFAGNTILKQTEGVYTILKKSGVKSEWIDKLNYEFVGGTPVLGIGKTVIIGHGHSSALAIENMVLSAERTIEAKLETHFKEALSK